MSTKNYVFAALAPTTLRAEVEEQMQLAHHYRNQLCELELQRRAAADATIRRLSPAFAVVADEYAAAQAVLDAAYDVLHQARSAARKRLSPTAQQAAAIKAATDVRDEVSDRMKAIKSIAYADLKALQKPYYEQAELQVTDPDLKPTTRKKLVRTIAMRSLAAANLDAGQAAYEPAQKEARANCGCYWGCVDDQTEILTVDGWKSHSQFVGTEVVATYNLATNRTEWQQATGKTEGDYCGPMLKVHSARLDMLLTPNHRIVCLRKAQRTGNVTTQVIRADEITLRDSNTVIPLAARGLEPTQPLPITPALASVLGWIIAEGNYSKASAGVSICQSEAANPEYCCRIRDALQEAGLEFTERRARCTPQDGGVITESGMITFTLLARGKGELVEKTSAGGRYQRHRPSSAQTVRRWIPDKRLTPELVFGLSRQAAWALFCALLRGDGSRSTTSTGKPRWRWIQKHEADCALFQALAQRLGIATTLQRRGSVHVVGVSRQRHAFWQTAATSRLNGKAAEWVAYNGLVWCPSTPNGTWIARRNGKIFVTGNSYLVVEDACKDFGTGAPPRFTRWEGRGTLGVQPQGGLDVTEALAGRSQLLRLSIPHEDVLYDRGYLHGSDAIGTVSFRIGSEGRDPIWAEIPVRFHRPLPHAGSIRFAYLHANLSPRGEEWSLRLTIAEPDSEQELPGAGIVALHFGWRTMEDQSLRVAVWQGSDGRHGEVCITAATLQDDAKLATIQATRDRWRDEFAPRLINWLDEQQATLPEWLTERTKTIAHWQAQSSFHQLCLMWRENRFAGDSQIFAALNTWRKEDKQLWQHHVRLRDRINGRRTDLYRKTLVRLSQEYRNVVMANVQWAKLKRKARSEDDPTQTAAQRHNASLAAPGEFSRLAKEYWGERVVLVPAKDITTRCHACGEASKSDRVNRVNTCEHCGAKWDIDRNAALNELASGTLLLNSEGSLAGEAGTAISEAGEDGQLEPVAAAVKKTRRNRRAAQI